MTDLIQKELERRKKIRPFQAFLHYSDADSAILTISIPPSDNHYYAVVRGRKIISKEGREYKESARKLLRPVTIQGRIRADVTVHARDKRRRDLNNLNKCLFDTLENCGFYPDDANIDDSRIRRGSVDERHFLSVVIERIKDD